MSGRHCRRCWWSWCPRWHPLHRDRVALRRAKGSRARVQSKDTTREMHWARAHSRSTHAPPTRLGPLTSQKYTTKTFNCSDRAPPYHLPSGRPPSLRCGLLSHACLLPDAARSRAPAIPRLHCSRNLQASHTRNAPTADTPLGPATPFYLHRLIMSGTHLAGAAPLGPASAHASPSPQLDRPELCAFLGVLVMAIFPPITPRAPTLSTPSVGVDTVDTPRLGTFPSARAGPNCTPDRSSGVPF